MLATVRGTVAPSRGAVASCDAGAFHTLPRRLSTACAPMDSSLSTASPAFSVALAVLLALLALTGFGVYQAFGPPSKGLTDPFDDHDD